jgi:hypothetical protein
MRTFINTVAITVHDPSDGNEDAREENGVDSPF